MQCYCKSFANTSLKFRRGSPPQLNGGGMKAATVFEDQKRLPRGRSEPPGGAVKNSLRKVIWNARPTGSR